MKKFFLMMISAMMILLLTTCSNSDAAVGDKSTTEEVSGKKNLVAYFSCTGNTKTLAQNVAGAIGADLYEIKPAVPYTSKDLDYQDETSRSTLEQRDENSRPALADKNLNMTQYETIIIAYPIWWGIEPKIIDTFVESYNFSGKTIIPVCTSGGSDIRASEDHLKNLVSSANWKRGKLFSRNASGTEIKSWFDGLK